MFNSIYLFWNQLLAVFVNSSSPVSLSYSVSVNGVSYYKDLYFNTTLTNFSYFLSASTLIGLSIFLFYQVYKVIHAFIGGVYE